MRRVLFAWELGYRLHHITNISALTGALGDGEYQLAVALRDLQAAPSLLSGTRLQYYQAPFSQGPPRESVARYGSYAHLLHASGFGDEGLLQVLVSAWVGIFASFRPDLVVFDHSPVALLASRGFDVRRVAVGGGFALPPAKTPFGIFPDVPRNPEVLSAIAADEERVLGVANAAARAHGIAPLERLADLYGQADERLVLSVPELDPFSEERSDPYLGPVSGSFGQDLPWPAGEGARVFVYLSDFPGLASVLEALRERNVTAWVYAGNLSQGIEAEFGGGGLHFERGLVNLASAARECDLFVSHGSHASVCHMLQAGVPQLILPYFREQELTASRVARLGAGRSAAWSTEAPGKELDALLEDPSFRAAAGAFASRNTPVDADPPVLRFRQCVEKLLG